MRDVAPYLLFVALLLVLLYELLAKYKKKRLQSYVNPTNLPQAVHRRNWLAFYVRVVCIVSSWIMLVMALLHPTSGPEAEEMRMAKSQEGGAAFRPDVDEIAFVLDVSASMGVKDTSVWSGRLARSKEIIESLLDNLGGIQISLNLFGENTVNEVPDTLDYLFFRILLDSVGINENVAPGTNLLAMSDAIKKKINDSPFNKKVLVVLLTDGEDTGFLDLPPSGLQAAETALYEKMRLSNARWDVIGVGSTEGGVVPGVTFEGKAVTSRLQDARLEQMAKSGQGHYYAESQVPFTTIVDNILADIAASGQKQALQGPTQGAYPEAASRETNQPLTSDIRFLLIAAILLLFAALALPQHEASNEAAL